MFIPHKANFKGISKKPELDPPLYADKILQKVIIDVNEKGTEAVGVTCEYETFIFLFSYDLQQQLMHVF